MLKDYGWLHLLLALCILLILQSIDYNGYADAMSDWQGKQCDYATNKTVHNYYNDKAGWFRVTKKKDLNRLSRQLSLGDTIVVGVDYYGLYSISSPLIPPQILQRYGRELMNGEVYRFAVHLEGDKMMWRQIQRR